jgi:hypothetical protein
MCSHQENANHIFLHLPASSMYVECATGYAGFSGTLGHLTISLL